MASAEYKSPNLRSVSWITAGFATVLTLPVLSLTPRAAMEPIVTSPMQQPPATAVISQPVTAMVASATELGANTQPPASMATSRPADTPRDDEVQTADDPERHQQSEASDSEPTLFLTIIGDRTYVSWGRAGDRPPRIDELPSGSSAGPADQHPSVEPLTDSSILTPQAAPNTSEPIEPTYGGNELERPFGPAPQECPRTLPAGSDQSTADELRRSSGCRYLSSCTVDSGECTWHYQGRG